MLVVERNFLCNLCEFISQVREVLVKMYKRKMVLDKNKQTDAVFPEFPMISYQELNFFLPNRAKQSNNFHIKAKLLKLSWTKYEFKHFQPSLNLDYLYKIFIRSTFHCNINSCKQCLRREAINHDTFLFIKKVLKKIWIPLHCTPASWMIEISLYK